MSQTVKAGWLKDSQGNKFAPKTLSSQVRTDDGRTIEDKFNAELTELENALAEKAEKEHDHAIADVTDLQTSLDLKVPTSRKINNKALSDDITLTASDVGADPAGSAASALSDAKLYADDLLKNAPDSEHDHNDLYYTKEEIDSMELITVADIDNICGATITYASTEVVF